MTGFVRSSLIAGLIGLAGAPFATAAAAPNLKVLLCTGDYGLYGQDRVPAIEPAVEKAALGAVLWEAHWAWRDLRGKMVDSKLVTPAPQDSLRAISSLSRDGKTVTTVVYYGLPVWGEHQRSERAQVALLSAPGRAGT